MIKNFSCLLILLVASFNFVLADSCKKRVEDSVHEFISTHPNLHAVYQFKCGTELIAKGASGYFSINRDLKLKPSQAMLIASGTKNIIAASILKLEEQKLLKVGDTLDKIFPLHDPVWKINKENGNKFPQWATKVTLHHLLTHSSGIKEYIFNINIDPTRTHHEINKQILHFAAGNELAFAPGQKSQYCNTGYVILGMVIEKLTKTDLATFLDKTFFKPLKMHNTHLVSLKEAVEYRQGFMDNLYPELYFAYYNGNTFDLKRAQTSFFFVPFADGGILSTAVDMVNWHYNLHNNKILKRSSYKKMIRPYFDIMKRDGQKSFVGYGVYMRNFNKNNIVYYHSGFAAGIRSESGYVPSKNFGFAIISNVMIMLEESKIAKVDFSKPANQIDIEFFISYVLNKTLQASNSLGSIPVKH
jgi:CubicO group peptidase (beta-lactamase class C family)